MATAQRQWKLRQRMPPLHHTEHDTEHDSEQPMDINLSAPVITRDEVLIDAPLSAVWKVQTDVSGWPSWRPQVPSARFDGELQVGSVFHWEEGGLKIESTVQEIEPQRRIVWNGPAQGINAIHVWEFTQTDRGVLVRTRESWDGKAVLAQSATLQPLLDKAIHTWLANLKSAAEAGPKTKARAGSGKRPPQGVTTAIKNALASVAVKDIDAAVQWYENVLGRPADATQMPELAEWKFDGGGWLQVYALAQRAGSSSCTLTVVDVDLEAARLKALGIATGELRGEQIQVFMVKDPDGNSIAFAQAPDASTTPDAVSIARAAYAAYVSKDRAAIEALISDDFHFTSPLDNRLDRAAYFARCWPNSSSTEGFEFIHLVPHGAQVFVTYEARGSGSRRFRNTEIVTVRGAHIVEIEVYFGWDLPHKAAVGGFVANAN